jgi:hypothetical protein
MVSAVPSALRAVTVKVPATPAVVGDGKALTAKDDVAANLAT